MLAEAQFKTHQEAERGSGLGWDCLEGSAARLQGAQSFRIPTFKDGKWETDKQMTKPQAEPCLPWGWARAPVVPKVGAAATEDVLVGIELQAIDFDDHVAELALESKLVEDLTGHRAHLPLHVRLVEPGGGRRVLHLHGTLGPGERGCSPGVLGRVLGGPFSQLSLFFPTTSFI